MLLTARAYAEGGRILCAWTSLQLDKEISSDDPAVRKEAADMVALVTPIVKGFLTDKRLDRDLALPAGLRRSWLHPRVGHGAVPGATPAST